MGQDSGCFETVCVRRMEGTALKHGRWVVSSELQPTYVSVMCAGAGRLRPIS